MGATAPENLRSSRPLPAPWRFKIAGSPTTSTPDQDWPPRSMKLLSESKGSVDRSSGIVSVNAAKYSVTVIAELPGFVTLMSVAQTPDAESIDPAPGIMTAWKLGGLTANRTEPEELPLAFAAVSVTVKLPAWVNVCAVTLLAAEAARVVPSPKSHAKVVLGSVSAAVKVTGMPAAALHVLLNGLNVAPDTSNVFSGGGGPPVPIEIDFVVVR